MNQMATVVKLAAMTILILLYIVTAMPLTLVRHRVRRLVWSTAVTSFFSRAALRLLRIDSSINGAPRPRQAGGALYVANHLSYLDVLILAAQGPAVFVTSVEVRHMPLLGLLARASSSLFVERRSRSMILHDLEGIAGVLRLGLPVVLFPEGTSSNGDGVLPFKTALMAAALKTEIAVVPICIKYRSVDNRPFNPATRDAICYYGDHTFITHFIRLCTLRSIEVSVSYLDSIDGASFHDRKQVARMAYAAIQAAYT